MTLRSVLLTAITGDVSVRPYPDTTWDIHKTVINKRRLHITLKC